MCWFSQTDDQYPCVPDLCHSMSCCISSYVPHMFSLSIAKQAWTGLHGTRLRRGYHVYLRKSQALNQNSETLRIQRPKLHLGWENKCSVRKSHSLYCSGVTNPGAAAEILVSMLFMCHVFSCTNNSFIRSLLTAISMHTIK